VGTGSGQGHRRGAAHGEAAGRAAREVPYLKANSEDPSMATETRRQPESTVADLGGCAENGDERGQSDSGRGRGNWSASRVADVGAELTVAKGTAGLQRRRRNELGRRQLMAAALWRARSVGGGGERGVCRCANEGEGGLGFGLKWPRAGWLRASHATWARRPRHAQLGAVVTRRRGS
jgi:hypothetical protein